MIATAQLKRRDVYLNTLIGFQDTEPVKIVTGIRRCGKSKLLELMIQHLLASGISEEQIVRMNFESYAFQNMTKDEFHSYVIERIIPGKRMYLFFDEPHKIQEWEIVVNSFRVDLDCDIYITGSNAHMLSSEYATYLSGRFVEIKMYPLSFSEFMYFHGFEIKETKSALGGSKKRAYDADGQEYALSELFSAFMSYGGMPGIADVGLEQEKVTTVLEGIYNTVIKNDILDRDTLSGLKKITNCVLLQKISLFLADNIGKEVSYTNITNSLISNKMVDTSGKSKRPYYTGLC